MPIYTSIKHATRKYIIEYLSKVESARFKEIRPPRVDTNLFTYHLNKLIQDGYVLKDNGAYKLAGRGLGYVDRLTTDPFRVQPDVVIMFLIQNSDGDVLLQQRQAQPYINAWSLPYGKVLIKDETLLQAAKREANAKLSLDDQTVTHSGDCYIRVRSNGEIISTTLVHLFKFNRDDIQTGQTIRWVRPHKLNQQRLAPAVEAVIARGFFNDPFFFEEFEEEWVV